MLNSLDIETFAPIVDVIVRRGSGIIERFDPDSNGQANHRKLFLGCSQIDVIIN